MMFPTRKIHSKSHYKLLLIALIVCLAVIPIVSAFDFDNVRSYDSETQTITITNAFGLGDKIAEVKLNTPLIYRVLDRGDGILQKVAEFEINNMENYDSVFRDMQFYNTKTMDSIDRNFVYKYKVKTGTEVIPIYEKECEYLKDETNS